MCKPRLRDGGSEFESQHWQAIFLFSQKSSLDMGVTQSTIQRGTREFSPGLKQPGLEADDSRS
jgi:hypothetical protein